MDEFGTNKIGYDLTAVANFFKHSATDIQKKVYPSRLSASNGYILSFLCENEGKDIFQKDIEKEFDIGRSSVSAILNEFEKYNLIERKSVTSDGRLKKVVVTPGAKIINDACKKEINHFFYDLASDLSDDEVKTFVKVLSTMKKNSERMRYDSLFWNLIYFKNRLFEVVLFFNT